MPCHALRREQPDQLPWIVNDIEEAIQGALMDGRSDFAPGELCRAPGMEGFGYHFPSGQSASDGRSMQTTGKTGEEAWYAPAGITFDFVPPWIADMGTDSAAGRTYVKQGLLTSRDALKYFDRFLPDPDHPGRYRRVADWLAKYREDFAVFARIRLGSASTFESMGLDAFSALLYDDPGLVMEIHRRFSEWSARVVQQLNKMDFDFLWIDDDHADTKARWINLEMWEEPLWGRSPRLFMTVALLCGALDRRGSPLDPVLRSLVTVRISQINWCRFCVDLNAATLARRAGSTDKVEALAHWRDRGVFDDRERAALQYAEAVIGSERAVDDERMARLGKHFDEDGIVELTGPIAFQNLSTKFNSALDVPAQGFCRR